MTSTPIIAWFDHLKQWGRSRFLVRSPAPGPGGGYWAAPPADLPPFVQHSPVARRYLALLGPLAWDQVPPRAGHPNGHPHPLPYAAFAAACLIKLDQQLVSMGALRRYLLEHPALVWLCGFPLQPSAAFPWGFNPQASLPSQRHFTRLLRQLPNSALQLLLDSTVTLLQTHLAAEGIVLGHCISMDTKHILAWVSAPCHARLHCLLRGYRPFATPIRSPPLATRETAW